MTSTASSGRHASRQVSRKVPVVRRTSRAGAPHGTSSSSRRCSRWLRSRSMSLAQVELEQALAGRRRHAQPPLQAREVRRAAATRGVSIGHAAEVLADDEPVVHEPQGRLGAGAEHRQHRVATSSRPAAAGRAARRASRPAASPRSRARATTSSPSSRSRRAARTSKRATAWSGAAKRWPYQPARSRRRRSRWPAQPGGRPRHPGRRGLRASAGP